MSLKDISLGRYVYGTSLLHRLDPRTKMICLLIIMVGLFAGNRWQLLLIAGIYILLAGFISGLTPAYLVRSIMPFKWLIILTVILNALFVGGHILIKAPLPYGGITREGLMLGTIYGVRIGMLVLAASLLTLTTEPVVLVTGVEKLLAPLTKFNIKPHEVAIAMIITIRFVPVLLDEAVKIRKSHAARGFNPKGVINRFKSVSILLLPLFSSAIRRAEHLAVAMECRLYRSEASRTRFKEIRMLGSDWTALSITVLFLLFMLVI
ncbi:MAG: energy-coupling factor transporter transmembrane protein EcfT [Candidatus Latescibacteria bacterium]|nr:energy-coupling factor transporter transmembrane protein EcfT [Candidatus Latescibacterota bacterium]